MGWDVTCRPATTEEIKAEIFAPTDRVTFTDIRITHWGQHLWAVAHIKDKTPCIVLYLVNRRSDRWACKAMDETMGPSYYDCPVALLDACPDPKEGYSTAWRKAIREKRRL